MFRFLKVAIIIMLGLIGCERISAQELDSTALAKQILESPQIGGGDYVPKISLSPDRTAVAFAMIAADVDENLYTIKWYILELNSGGSPTLVGEGGDLIQNIRQRTEINGAIYGVQGKWSPDSKWIAYPMKKDGETQIWRSRRDGSIQEQVTFNDADVFGTARYEALFEWSENGSKIYYEVARNREDMQIAIAEEGRQGFLYDDRFHPGYSKRPLWIRCGGTRQGEQGPKSQTCTPTLWTKEISSDVERVATGAESAEYERLRGENDDGGVDEYTDRKYQFITEDGVRGWFQNIDPETYRGAYPPLSLLASFADSVVFKCQHKECEGQYLESAWWMNNRVVFQRRTGVAFEKTAFYSWDPLNDTLQEILSGNEWFYECKAANKLICIRESATHPRELVALSIDNGDVSSLFAPTRLPDAAIPKIEYLTWSEDDNRSAYGVLLYPAAYKEGKTYPLIIAQHEARGFLRGGGAKELPVYSLAYEGFFVLVPVPYTNHVSEARYRGIEKAMEDFKTFQIRKNALNSFSRAIDMLDQRGLIDNKRVGITGLSTGSANAKYALIHSDIFSAVSISTGYSGPQQYWYAPSALRRSMDVILDGISPVSEDFAEFSSNEQLGYHAREKLFPPILMQASDSEISHAVFDHVLLADQGHPVEMYVYPDEYHIKYQPIHRYYVYRRNIEWFNFWLRGETASEPVDAEQYRRWTALCETYILKLKASKSPADNVRAKQQVCALASDF